MFVNVLIHAQINGLVELVVASPETEAVCVCVIKLFKLCRLTGTRAKDPADVLYICGRIYNVALFILNRSTRDIKTAVNRERFMKPSS